MSTYEEALAKAVKWCETAHAEVVFGKMEQGDSGLVTSWQWKVTLYRENSIHITKRGKSLAAVVEDIRGELASLLREVAS